MTEGLKRFEGSHEKKLTLQKSWYRPCVSISLKAFAVLAFATFAVFYTHALQISD